MARNEAISGFWTALLTPSIYKRTQGKRVRQTTAALLVAWAWFGCYTLASGPLSETNRNVELGIPTALGVVAIWLAFRLVNYPAFADFLIAVEAEMKKISWPTLRECFRAAAVVIATMLFLAAVLFVYDQFWIWFFELIKVLRV